MSAAPPLLTLAADTLSYFQAIVIGMLQGVTELFPISSLGHSVLVPELLGWDKLVTGQSADESFYLAFLVGLHVATAIALLVFFRHDWVAIIGGFFTSIAHAPHRDARRAHGVAARARHHPGRHRRARVRAQPAHRRSRSRPPPRSSSPSTG